MAIPYDPRDAAECLPEGGYDAELQAVEEGVSKSSQKPMYTLSWCIVRNERTFRLKDYIPIPSMLWKLKELAVALGEEAAFNSATFDPSLFIGKIAKLELDVQMTEKYGERNQVAGYHVSDMDPNDPTWVAAMQKPGAGGEDIPF